MNYIYRNILGNQDTGGWGWPEKSSKEIQKERWTNL